MSAIGRDSVGGMEEGFFQGPRMYVRCMVHTTSPGGSCLWMGGGDDELEGC